MQDVLFSLSFTTPSSNNATGLSFTATDLRDVRNLGDTLNLQLLVKTKNLGGGGGIITLNYAMLAQAGLQLSEIDASMINTLAVTSPAASNARNIKGTAKIDQLARYLYTWYTVNGMFANSLVDLILYINGRSLAQP
jgi:hypothetical protein